MLFLTRESFMGVIERRKLTCPQLGQVLGPAPQKV